MNKIRVLAGLIGLILQSLTYAVTNGAINSSESHPWLVKIDTCAGAIISSRFIVTAAHCIADKTVGLVTLKVNDGTRLKRSKNLHIHPQYKPWGSDHLKRHDIAIIETSSPIAFNQLVRPINLNTQRNTAQKKLSLSGWGRKEDHSYPREPYTINGLNVLPNFDSPFWQILDNDFILESDSLKQNFRESFLTGDFLAIAVSPELEQSACRGDSGAPLIDLSTKELVAIVAHGQDNCLEQPSFFATDIYSHLQWIYSIFDKNEELL